MKRLRRKRLKGNFNQTLAPLLFLAPNMFIFTIFIIIPALQGLHMSLMKWSILGTPTFVGLQNFQRLVRDQVFWITVKNTVVYSLFAVILVTVISLMLGLLLHQNKLRGEKTFRSIFYIPSLLSMIVVGIAWRFILGDEMGVINYVLRRMGGSGAGWLTNSALAMASIIFVSLWSQAGYYMVVMISGLQAIPLELYEAAGIDGATPMQTFLKVTLPLLRSTILVVVVLSTIGAFKAYELVKVMTNGGPGYATKFIVQQVYQAAFVEDRMGYASAMSLVLMLIIGVFTIAQFRLTGGEQDYE